MFSSIKSLPHCIDHLQREQDFPLMLLLNIDELVISLQLSMHWRNSYKCPPLQSNPEDNETCSHQSKAYRTETYSSVTTSKECKISN